MSRNQGDTSNGAHYAASQLLARGAADDVRARRGADAMVGDFFVSDIARLDDRARAALSAALSAHLASVEQALRQHASRMLTTDGQAIAAALLADGPLRVEPVLRFTGLLQSGMLVRELAARVRQEIIDETMPPAEANADRSALLMGLADHPDALIAGRARALQRAVVTRRSARDAGRVPVNDVSAEIHHQLVWQSAAALRIAFAGHDAAGTAALDRALTEAALRCLVGHDEGERVEAAAMRLVAVLDPFAEELPELAATVLRQSGTTFFCALLAHGLGLDYDSVRDMVLDPIADRLWLVLRALSFDRPSIAHIGLALCDADPRRDVDGFADDIAAIMAVTPEAARGALARTRLHPDFREAVMALAQSRPQ
ncbi:MAG: hypothetical protein ACKVOB_06200 [Sphingomonas sp.]